jgi:hypothetical protein
MDEDREEIEILSYQEFRNREALSAWRDRQRAHECGGLRFEPARKDSARLVAARKAAAAPDALR